jgi:hypothetical protein
MTTSVATVVNEKPSSTWQDEFVARLLPQVKTHARCRFRDLPPFEREEAEADAVAVAMVFFVRLVKRGRNPCPFALRIARIAIMRVKSGRVVGSRDRSRDVMSRLARQQRGIQIESLDAREQSTSGEWQQIVVEDRRTGPAEIAASRIDFSAWLARMTSRRRELAEMLAAGHTTSEAAERFSLSLARISQLRREFEASWRAYQQQADGRQMAAA